MTTRGEKVCQFIERYCLIPEGAQVGQPMKLMPFQKKFILDVYDNPAGTSRAYLSVARKNGKSALIAAIMFALDQSYQNLSFNFGGLKYSRNFMINLFVLFLIATVFSYLVFYVFL